MTKYRLRRGRSEEQTAAVVSPWVKATFIIRRELSVVTLSLCTPHMCVNVMLKRFTRIFFSSICK